MKKRILSFVVAICLVFSLVPAMAMTTEAAGTGTSSDPIVVYRNPELDKAGSELYDASNFNVRQETINLWRSQIIEAANSGGWDVENAVDVKYYISTGDVFLEFDDSVAPIIAKVYPNIPSYLLNIVFKDTIAAHWFGWAAVESGTSSGKIDKEKVIVVDENGNALVGSKENPLYVAVKGYIDVAWDINFDGDTTDTCDITNQIALNNNLSDAKTAAEAAALEYAEEQTNATDYAYTFVGWEETVVTDTIDVDNAPTVDGSVYTAKYSIVEKGTYYDVIFDANGGTGVMENQTIKSGNYQDLASNEFEREGYEFIGWNTAADGTGTPYAAGASITLTEDITLYAIWEKIIIPTTISVVDDEVEVTYGDYTSDSLLKLINPTVMAENSKVENAVVTVTDITNEDVGTYTVTLTYEGNEDYAASTATATVVINPAIANVVVKSQTVKYGETVVDPIEANCNTIDIVAGIDGHDETYLVGQVQVALPSEMATVLALYAAANGYDTNNLTIDQVKALLTVADEKYGDEMVSSVVAYLKDYTDTIEKLIDTLKKIQSELPMDSELVISVVDEVTMPTNVGVYLIGSIAADKNYVAEETDNVYSGMDAGYLIITPNGIKAELAWNATDDNDIITLGKLSRFDLGATATVIASTVEGATHPDNVNEHVEYLFVGVDENGELLLDRCTNPKARKLDLGVYAQVAYVANWDNVMYYAEPIARPIVIAPNVADVAILDVNGNENYAQVFTYDGTPKSVTVTVDGVENVEGLVVEYIGSDTTVDGWYRTEAPTDAGVYTVVATYTETNANGKLVKAGGAVGVLIIEPADNEVGLKDAKYEYDGNQYFATIENTSLDYITVAIDRENNIAYVNVPEDTEAHIDRIVGMMPAEVETEIQAILDKYADFDGDVQTSTIQAEMTDVINALIEVEMSTETVALAEELVAQLEAEFAANEDIQNAIDDLKSQISALEDEIRGQIPDDIEKTLEDYIREIVTVNEGVDIDVDKVKADINEKIAELEAELPAPVVKELKEMANEVIAVIETNVDVDAIEAELENIVAEIESLEAVDAETVVKYILGAAYGAVDMEQVEALLAEVVAKVEARGYVDYLVGMAEDIASMYDGDIDTSAVTEAIDEFTAALEAKLQSGNIDSNDLDALEEYVDNILASLLTVVDQIPEGTIIFGQNPSEVGIYDCYAINISANYKAEFVSAQLEIYEVDEPVVDDPVVDDPVIPQNPTAPEKPDVPESPKTGYTDYTFLFSTLIAVAAVALVIAAVYRRRTTV